MACVRKFNGNYPMKHVKREDPFPHLEGLPPKK